MGRIRSFGQAHLLLRHGLLALLLHSPLGLHILLLRFADLVCAKAVGPFLHSLYPGLACGGFGPFSHQPLPAFIGMRSRRLNLRPVVDDALALRAILRVAVLIQVFLPFVDPAHKWDALLHLYRPRPLVLVESDHLWLGSFVLRPRNRLLSTTSGAWALGKWFEHAGSPHGLIVHDKLPGASLEAEPNTGAESPFGAGDPAFLSSALVPTNFTKSK